MKLKDLADFFYRSGVIACNNAPVIFLYFVWQKHNRQVNAFCKAFVGRAVSFIKNSSSGPSFFMFFRYITCQPVLHQPNSLEFMMVASDIFMSSPAFYLPLGFSALFWEMVKGSGKGWRREGWAKVSTQQGLYCF